MSAALIRPPLRSYSGSFTEPARWHALHPRPGDILVCTPPKSGTTWTQAILAMLVNGGPDLPGKVPVISPWVDADFGVPVEEVLEALDVVPGRWVLKTHTPADGVPVWEGVTMISVYRHPLDVFFSLRKHVANTAEAPPDHPMLLPLSRSLRAFADAPLDTGNFDRDTLATLAVHYRETVLSGRVPAGALFHYADMVRDHRGAVAAMARAAGIAADEALVDAVTRATAFGAMQARAGDYAPAAGTGHWKSDAAFFDSASSRKWEGRLSAGDIAHFDARLAELIPEEGARRWLLEGGASGVTPASIVQAAPAR